MAKNSFRELELVIALLRALTGSRTFVCFGLSNDACGYNQHLFADGDPSLGGSSHGLQPHYCHRRKRRLILAVNAQIVSAAHQRVRGRIFHV